MEIEFKITNKIM